MNMKPRSDLAPQAAIWGRLWKTGVLHSCASGIPGNYDREILAFWLDRFRWLSDGDVVVDVGTGNGAIPLLALSHARNRRISLQIHGVDLADIAPTLDVPGGSPQYGSIRFHPRTSMTSLPFSRGEVKLLCSQFAFEYAPRADSAHEILRVIGDNGTAAMIIHSADSVISAVANTQLQACRWLLQESDLFHATERLLRAMAGAVTPSARAALALDASAEVARLAFNRAAEELMAHVETDPAAEILQQTAQRISQVLQRPMRTLDQVACTVSDMRRWVEDEEQRLLMMQGAAMDRRTLEETARSLGASGLPVRTGQLLYDGGTCMGWTVVVGNG